MSRLIAKDSVTSPVRRPFVEFEGPAGEGEVNEQVIGKGRVTPSASCSPAHSAWASGWPPGSSPGVSPPQRSPPRWSRSVRRPERPTTCNFSTPSYASGWIDASGQARHDDAVVQGSEQGAQRPVQSHKSLNQPGGAVANRNVALVTGASAGVGRAVVRRFAQEGFDVGLVARGRGGLSAAAKEAEACGARALVLPADVTSFDEVDAAAAEAESGSVQSTSGSTTPWPLCSPRFGTATQTTSAGRSR